VPLEETVAAGCAAILVVAIVYVCRRDSSGVAN